MYTVLYIAIFIELAGVQVEIKVLKKLLKGFGEYGFNKKYRLIEVLNSGGNSHSYKAYSYSLKTNVFIKFFLLPRHEIELLKFRNEIAIHKVVSRQGFIYDKNAVIEMIDAKLFKDNLGGYLVLEWLEGKPLDKVIENYASKSIEEKVQLFHRVANALIPLSSWIIHRDLHPSNIMVLDDSFEYERLRHNAYDPKIKIIDFGESYSEYVTVVGDLDNSDLRNLKVNNSRRLTTSLYSTPPEYLKDYSFRRHSESSYTENYDSWALGLIGYKIFFNEDLFVFKDIKEYVEKLQSNHFQMDIDQKIENSFYNLKHRQSQVLKHIFYYLLRADPIQRAGDGKIGQVLYLINFKNYELSQNLASSEYLSFIKNGFHYLDARGMTHIEDRLLDD